MLYQSRAASSWLCALGEFSSCESLSQAAAGHVHTPRTDTAWSAINGVTACQTTSSVQSPPPETSTQHRQECSGTHHRKQRAAAPCCLDWKNTSFKANLYRLTHERCWTSLLLLKNRDANHLELTWKVQILTYCLITTWSFKSFWLFDHLHKARTESKHTHRTISILSPK